MNSSETDSLREILLKRGFDEALSPLEADVAIINTCSVRKTAEDRIEGRIGYYSGLRNKKGSSVRVVFMGCMAQNRGMEIRRKFPDTVSLVWGTYNKEKVAELISRIGESGDSLDQGSYKFMKAAPQKGFGFKSYVPISHGCDNFCSYCIVPFVRGREICRNSSEIIDNIRALLDNGVLEVTLLGQNVNSYRDGSLDFPDLLDKISSLTNIPRLTFMTSHPGDFSKRLSDVIKTHNNILKTVHLPLQSANDRILKLMSRNYSFNQYLDKISWIKEIQNVTISTDIITGFPSETEEEFMDTLNAMKYIRFDEAFMYYFNPRPLTRASSLSSQLSLDTRKQRLSELILIQRRISVERLSSFTGYITNALIESVSKKDPGELIGRSHNGLIIFVKGDESLIGKIIPVKLIKPSGTGLKAEIIK